MLLTCGCNAAGPNRRFSNRRVNNGSANTQIAENEGLRAPLVAIWDVRNDLTMRRRIANGGHDGPPAG